MSTPFWRSCGPGDDLIRGCFGNGDDAIYGGLSSDAIYGDDGDDCLYAAGGGGSDPCVVGPEDLAYTSGCEVLYVQ
jgi:hypothetical protein